MTSMASGVLRCALRGLPRTGTQPVSRNRTAGGKAPIHANKSGLKDAGLETIRFYDLRHTYASLLIEQGENIKHIQTNSDTPVQLLP
jgi:integrase